MEKRLLIAAALSLAVLLLWEWVGPKPPRRAPAPVNQPPASALPSPAPSEPAVSAPAAAPTSTASAAPVAAASESTETLENTVFRAAFANRGAVLKSFVLSAYRDEQGHPLELIASLPAGALRPLGLDFPKNPDLTRQVSEALFVVEREGKDALRFRWSGAGVSITKEIHITSGYLFDVKVSVAASGSVPFGLVVGPGLRNPTDRERASRYVMPPSAVLSAADGLKLVRPEKTPPPESFPLSTRGFAGVEDNYFLAVVIPRGNASARIAAISTPRPDGKPVNELATVVSGGGALDCSAYFGPKDVGLLEATGLGLERTVDFGWYGILARPLLWMLKKAYGWVGNYGIAILLVTFVIRLLLFPLTAKSYSSMKKMQKLAPKMNAIRDKYKKARSDAAQRQKMNQELMTLYQAEGYNPMSGCLPMLLQLPILVAFYNVLSRTIELRHAPFFLWIKDLSAIDQSYVLVILMIVSMYVQQAMTPSTMDPAQKKIFLFMPVIWGFFLKDMPSGLVLYWLFSNLLTILQQLVMNRIVKDDSAPPPKVAAKALKQARA